MQSGQAPCSQSVQHSKHSAAWHSTAWHSRSQPSTTQQIHSASNTAHDTMPHSFHFLQAHEPYLAVSATLLRAALLRSLSVTQGMQSHVLGYSQRVLHRNMLWQCICRGLTCCEVKKVNEASFILIKVLENLAEAFCLQAGHQSLQSIAFCIAVKPGSAM